MDFLVFFEIISVLFIDNFELFQNKEVCEGASCCEKLIDKDFAVELYEMLVMNRNKIFSGLEVYYMVKNILILYDDIFRSNIHESPLRNN